MYRLMTVVILLVLLLATTTAFGGIRLNTARYLAMGNTGLASADDGGTLGLNPANLASTNLVRYADHDGMYDDKPWKMQCAQTAEFCGGLDYWGLHRAVRNIEKNWGFGVSYYSVSSSFIDADSWAVGFGSSFDTSAWNWGVAIRHLDSGLFGPNSGTILDLGLQGHLRTSAGIPIKLGAVVSDITSQLDTGPFYNVGLAAMFDSVLVEIDWWDLTDEFNSTVNVGLEWQANHSWRLRAGLIDGDDLTAGVGYEAGHWNFDATWMETPKQSGLQDEYTATVSHRWKWR